MSEETPNGREHNESFSGCSVTSCQAEIYYPTAGENIEHIAYVLVEENGDQYLLHYENICLMVFPDNEKYNHIQWNRDDGSMQAIPPDNLLDQMYEAGYKMSSQPFVDLPTKKWFNEACAYRAKRDTQLGLFALEEFLNNQGEDNEQ